MFNLHFEKLKCFLNVFFFFFPLDTFGIFTEAVKQFLKRFLYDILNVENTGRGMILCLEDIN